MKKLFSSLLAVCMAVAIMFTFVGCKSVKYKAVQITDIELEEYGFAISKQASNKEAVLNAMNAVISELGTEKIMNHLTYHQMLEQGDTSGTPGFEVTEPTTDTTNGTLVVYTNAAFPPYEYISGDKVVGLDIDMMKLVANKLGMAFEVVDQDFDTLFVSIDAIEEGKTKVVAAGMTINDERKESAEFSNPYISSIQYIVCAEDANYQSFADLKGKKIGVQLGTTGDFAVDDQIKEGVLKDSGAEVLQYKSAALAFAAMKAGKVDVVVIDEHPAKSLVANQ